jgi:WD40 repeat protein
VDEPVLVLIMKHLSCEEVAACGLVCRHWHTAATDNLLWRFLCVRDFRAERVLSAEEWRPAYIRAYTSVPKVHVQTLTGHSDEVLHVAFSHDGTHIASCAKVSLVR